MRTKSRGRPHLSRVPRCPLMRRLKHVPPWRVWEKMIACQAPSRQPGTLVTGVPNSFPPPLETRKFAAQIVRATLAMGRGSRSGLADRPGEFSKSVCPEGERHDVPSIARPCSGPPHRGRGKDGRWHHHPGHREGKTAGRRGRRRRTRRAQRGRAACSLSTSRWATAFCSANGPAPRSSLDGEDLLIMKESDVMGVIEAQAKLRKAA